MWSVKMLMDYYKLHTELMYRSAIKNKDIQRFKSCFHRCHEDVMVLLVI